MKMNLHIKTKTAYHIFIWYFNLLTFDHQLIGLHSYITSDLQKEELQIGKRPTNACATLKPSADKTIAYYHCMGNGSESCNKENGFVPENTTAIVQCNQNYKLGEESEIRSICLGSSWTPSIEKCTPECGRQYRPKAVSLILGGVEENIGDSPWHVAVYGQKKVLICSGTIISPKLIVSAAHCFHVKSSNQKINASEFEVVAGKFTRDYFKVDDDQQAFKIKEIRESSNGYIGWKNLFYGDIAVLILENDISIGRTIMPACIDWIGLLHKIYPEDATIAKVSGWGEDETGEYSNTLKTANIPYISHNSCRSIGSDDFKAFVTADKFCAGSETQGIIGVHWGDSGGGLLFQQDNLYYLRGVVSTKHFSSSAIATFTDLADHIKWIFGIYNEIEQQEADTKLNPGLSLLLREANSAILDDIRDLSKLFTLSKRLKEEIIDAENISNDLKSHARSLYRFLISTFQISAVQTYSDAFTDYNLTMVSKFGPDFAEACFECFRKVIDEVVDHVIDKLGSNEVISMVRNPNVFRTIPERIAISVAIFNKIKQNGDMNIESFIQLAEYIKETMEMANFDAAVQSHAYFLMMDIPHRLPKSVKNLVFFSKICIRNVEWDEYLYAFNTSSVHLESNNDSRHLSLWSMTKHHAYTWKGSLLDPKDPEAFAWKLKRHQNGYQIFNAKYNERMFVGELKFDVHRRHVFTWKNIEDGSLIEGLWQFVLDGDDVYIINTHYKEYLFADSIRFQDGHKRFTFTVVPEPKAQLGCRWRIVSCPNQ